MKILLINYTIHLNMLVTSRAMRAEGHSVELLCFDAVGHDEYQNSFERILAFDWFSEERPFRPAWILRTLLSGRFWNACGAAFTRLMSGPYDVIYAQSEPNWWSCLGSWWFKTIHGIPIVYHPYDSSSLLLPQRQIPWFERLAERWFFRNAHALVHKMDTNKLQYLQGITSNLPDRVMQFLPFLPSSEFPDIPTTRHIPSAPRIVYLGGVQFPSPLRDFRYTQDRQAEIVASAGAEFHVYPAPLNKTGKVHMRELERLARDCPFLRIHPGQSFGRSFLREVSQYDYGWFVDRYNKETTCPHFAETAFGQKVFAYIAAGLPIIVLKDFQFVADYIQKRSIGIVIEDLDSKDLKQKLANVDYPRMRERVLRLRSEITVEANIGRLIQLFADLAGKMETG